MDKLLKSFSPRMIQIIIVSLLAFTAATIALLIMGAGGVLHDLFCPTHGTLMQWLG